MDRRGVAKYVRRDLPRQVPLARAQRRRLAADQRVDPEPGERRAMP
jgi:hypothetical protein